VRTGTDRRGGADRRSTAGLTPEPGTAQIHHCEQGKPRPGADHLKPTPGGKPMSDGPGSGDPGDDAVPGRGGFDLPHLQAACDEDRNRILNGPGYGGARRVRNAGRWAAGGLVAAVEVDR